MVNGNRWKKISMWQLERPTKMTEEWGIWSAGGKKEGAEGEDAKKAQEPLPFTRILLKGTGKGKGNGRNRGRQRQRGRDCGLQKGRRKGKGNGGGNIHDASWIKENLHENLPAGLDQENGILVRFALPWHSAVGQTTCLLRLLLLDVWWRRLLSVLYKAIHESHNNAHVSAKSKNGVLFLWSIQQSQYVLAFHWNFWHFWHWVFDWLGSQYKRKSWSVRRWGSGKMKEATKRRLGLTLIFLGAMLQLVIETLTEKPRNVYRIVAASRRASWVECNLSRFYFECVPRISSSQWLQGKIICLSWPVTSCHWLAVILHTTRHSRRSAQLLECHFPCCRVCCNSQRSIGIARRMQGAVRVCLLQSNTVG